MKRRYLLSLFSILCLLCLPMAFATASEPETFTLGKYTYALEEDGAILVDYTGAEEALLLPKAFDGHPLVAIGEYAFSEKVSLLSVVIPEGVRTVGSCAFYKCSNLTGITLPNSLTDIASDAFAMTALKDIALSQDHSTYSLYEGVLYNKKEKTLHTYPGGKMEKSFQVPKGILEIGNDAFFSNSTLTSIEIPETVTTIGNLAFGGMSNLTSLYLPDSVNYIGYDAFENSGIERFEVSDTNTWLKATDGVLYNPEKKTLEWYPPAKEGSRFAIPPGILHIGEYAFDSAINLETIQIPGTVQDIGKYAFRGSSLTSLVIPDNVKEIGKYAFAKSSIKEITLPQGLTAIPEGMLYHCDLKSLTLPATITSIGHVAFCSVWEMTSLTIPNGVTEIGIEAFYGCKDLMDVTLPASVVSIGEDAFGKCDQLTLWVVDGSHAQAYAKENGLTYAIMPDWL